MFSQSHSNWLQTVPTKPEAILFKFVPITSLLAGIPGSGYLSHAINLYLRCKCSYAQPVKNYKFAVIFLSLNSIDGYDKKIQWLQFRFFFSLIKVQILLSVRIRYKK